MAQRARQAARHYRELAQRIERQEMLLELIAETMPVGCYIIDADQQIRYANHKAAHDAQMQRELMLEKPVSHVFGKDRSTAIIAANEEALKGQAPQLTTERNEQGKRLISYIERSHHPLEAIPLPDEQKEVAGVLLIEQNLTELVASQERHERALSDLIATLVTVMDKRDPHAAHHSKTVAAVAAASAETMNLSYVLIETARTAGLLMNIGKLMIPHDVLSSDDIDEKERKQIRESMHEAAKLVEHVSFDGPVVETLRQAQEKVDGSGPLGLKSHDILVTARIIHAVNHFVAMISPRAYRDSIPVDDALSALLKEIDKEYDRDVVAALINLMDNQGGRKLIEQCKKE
jgi:HD-GYP domain-containing protein (c-di-GMP phosphodiesterase class II)